MLPEANNCVAIMPTGSIHRMVAKKAYTAAPMNTDQPDPSMPANSAHSSANDAQVLDEEKPGPRRAPVEGCVVDDAPSQREEGQDQY